MHRSRMKPSRERDVAEAARRAFERCFSGPPEGLAFAPGRVNLIGEHTDYNDGFVLPMAIDEGIAAAFSRRTDRILRVYASDFGQTREIDLGELRNGKPAVRGWFRYAAGVAWAMQAAGRSLSGADIVTAANLPSGAGLSSSAAFELAIARALSAAAEIPWDPRAAARMAQRAEHEFAGVACGIMDQMVVACAREDTALLLDCRSLETQDVPLPPTVRIVVMNTGIRRSLSASEYNDRRASCERAVAAIRHVQPSVRALRDVDPPLLQRARELMDATAFRRASHVVVENARPDILAGALAAGDLATAGRVMRESHDSLRDLYDVSCPELDALVDASSALDGCYGARLTGAGFGGCAIALVDGKRVESFTGAVTVAYMSATGRQTAIIVSRAREGTRLVSLP
jgi:galactokinase